MKSKVPLVLALLTLAFAQTLAAATDNSPIHHNVVASPKVGSETEASSGDPLLLSSEETVVEWARLKSDTLVSKSGMILPKDLLLECDIEERTGLKQCCKGYSAALYCLKDLDHDGRFDKVQIVAGGRPVEHLLAAYEIVLQPDVEKPRWKRELIFQGAAAGVLHLTYREYLADWSHPNVSNDLVYDIASSGPTDVTYKGAHLVFASIAGNGARYKLVAGFARN